MQTTTERQGLQQLQNASQNQEEQEAEAKAEAADMDDPNYKRKDLDAGLENVKQMNEDEI